MNDRVTRRGFVATVGAIAIAGCSGVTGDRSSDRSTAMDDSATSAATTSTASGEGSLPPLADRSLVLPMEPPQLREAAVSGGVSKDGIPAIDQPRFEAAGQVGGRLAPGDVVFGIARNGVAKAYPQSILVHHEVCNDTLDGTPIGVTYCPLTGTAVGFERGETTFGVSGRLVNDNLIMYDRATEHWWPQVLATAIPGWNADGDASGTDGGRTNGAGSVQSNTSGSATSNTSRDGTPNATIGRSLREFRVVWTTWQRWRDQFPDTRVLTEDTGYIRDYGQDPYGSYSPPSGYYEPESEPLFPPLDTDDRYPTKAVVVGARTTDGAIAFHKRSLRREGVITGSLDGTPHVGVHDDRLDTAYVYRNADGASVTTTPDGVRVADTVHPPDELPLERVHAFDAMWFAWHGFYPATSVYG
ncbi:MULTISPECIES: DUF3179 domain-containing protein [Halococcus]|uniref:DUF3179 domain-containing protein n=1 Tax=Halococcus salifodinae DSM 8989 TaxID=1227456 RepID=M0N883_9EURY|nr:MULTISPECIES: DUF3179 domain-containing protein [Halococcus]EMA53324.1 hypothetical protein C450_08417 [Halococcus salifodinae DSM 8989]